MLEKGDDVRVAGVSVGEVKEVEHYERNQALVTFRVKADVAADHAPRGPRSASSTWSATATSPSRRAATPTRSRSNRGDTMPIEQTSPALDLTTLFNGFKPLFQALKPEDVNELTLNLVQVLQGEGGTVAGPAQKTASLTTTLADRDQLIGDVIDNLTTTLETVDSRSEQLTTLVTELKDWMRTSPATARTIGSSLATSPTSPWWWPTCSATAGRC